MLVGLPRSSEWLLQQAMTECKLRVNRHQPVPIRRAAGGLPWQTAWSEHVAPVAGTRSCRVAHLGLVLEGRMMVRMDDGEEFELKSGDIFQIAPGHDSWVLGDRPYVSIHLMGAEQYAT